MMSKRNCDVCGLPIDNWEDRHSYHEESCPNFVIFANAEQYMPHCDCDCDLVAHQKCCPQCNPGKKGRDGASR